jgi:hypothetical protein
LKEGNKKAKNNGVEFINKIFHGTQHELVNGADNVTTLFLSLEHPNKNIRLLSLDQLENMASKSDPNDQMV